MAFTSKDFDFSAPFWGGLDDAEQTFDLIVWGQSGRLDWPIYNLLCSVRDLTMFCHHGMKPHRYWRLKDVKAYFGIKGSKEKILEQLEFLRACAFQEQETT